MSAQSVAFDRAAEYYDATRGFPAGHEVPIAALIAQVGKLKNQSRVLEVGIGTGRIGLPLARHSGAYFGIDLAVPMMNKLREKQDDEPVYLAQADATRLPFADNCFDAAVAVHVFHLIPGWQQALNEVARVLKPGALLLDCWDESDQDPRFTALWDAWNAAIPEERRQSPGADRRNNPNVLAEQGWRPQAQDRYRYSQSSTPRELLDLLHRRVFSRLWQMTDEDIRAGLTAMEGVMDDVFPDRDEVVTQAASFYVRPYLPPQVQESSNP